MAWLEHGWDVVLVLWWVVVPENEVRSGGRSMSSTSTLNLTNTASLFRAMDGRASPPPALAPGTFSSVLPTVEDILGLVYRLSEGKGANDEIVSKVGPPYASPPLLVPHFFPPRISCGKWNQLTPGQAHCRPDRGHEGRRLVPPRGTPWHRRGSRAHAYPRGAGGGKTVRLMRDAADGSAVLSQFSEASAKIAEADGASPSA